MCDLHAVSLTAQPNKCKQYYAPLGIGAQLCGTKEPIKIKTIISQRIFFLKRKEHDHKRSKEESGAIECWYSLYIYISHFSVASATHCHRRNLSPPASTSSSRYVSKFPLFTRKDFNRDHDYLNSSLVKMGSSSSKPAADAYDNLKTPVNRMSFTVAPRADNNSGYIKKDSKTTKYAFQNWETTTQAAAGGDSEHILAGKSAKK